MLRILFTIFFIIILSMPANARTNNEIARQLYNNARKIEKTSFAKAQYARDAIASFMIDLNMLYFNESMAVWKPLSSGYYYDSRSLQKIYGRYLGVYKDSTGNMMGIFDVNCEDFNDPQERMYGFVKTTEVYFNGELKLRNGHSKGLAKTFCSNQ